MNTFVRLAAPFPHPQFSVCLVPNSSPAAWQAPVSSTASTESLCHVLNPELSSSDKVKQKTSSVSRLVLGT